MRGVLELGVVGTPKELWARLNEDGGLPAATLLRLACHFEGLHAEVGERSRAVLESLKPGLLQSLDIDGNVDTQDTSRLLLSLVPGGGNGDGSKNCMHFVSPGHAGPS